MNIIFTELQNYHILITDEDERFKEIILLTFIERKNGKLKTKTKS